ncbi:MAG TPA: hypothetical protein VLA00_15850 [Xanthobacteraceae bacterium]|nr:hypothetical protein [Xanthobacteraceae bacterium]
MLIPSQAEYEHAKAALAVYAEFSKPYVQRNGWTVVPADAPRPIFDDTELTTDRVNAFSTTVELFELNRDKPERIFAYVSSGALDGKSDWRVSTWTGALLSSELIAGRTFRGGFGARITPIRARINGAWYHGRALGPGMHVKLKRCAA